MIRLPENPIERIEWRDPNTLTGNSYNPNFVMTKELRLLERNMKKFSWIQPILITEDGTIIDGFHRHLIAKKNEWLVPCCVMRIDAVQRRLLTVSVNRAKGSHIAVRMSDLVQGLLADGVSKEEIAESIGGDITEVELLARKDVFEKFSLDGYEYSKSWIPRKKKESKRSQAQEKA